MNIYTLFDRKAEAFNKPFVSVTDGTAMRDLQAGIREDASNIDPNDFVLYCTAEFDTITGRTTASELRHVIDIAELVAMMSPNRLSEPVQPELTNGTSELSTNQPR